MKIKKSIACVSAALLASSAFVGCSGSSAGENGTINVFNCGDYIDPSLIKQFEKETGIKGKNLFMPIRIAVSGEMHGPELPDTIYLLGREKSIQHIEKMLEKIR